MGVPDERVHKATSESENKANVLEEIENVASDVDKKYNETDINTEEQKDHLQGMFFYCIAVFLLIRFNLDYLILKIYGWMKTKLTQKWTLSIQWNV